MSQSFHNRAEGLIFASRWLQAPMYAGLIIAQVFYVYKFLHELQHLVWHVNSLSETEVLLIMLGLVDAVMVANLLVMVIVGGYETFVSRLEIDGHPDKPDWLSHVDAGVLKIKLAASLVTISSVHLLKSFINIDNTTSTVVIAQVGIHLAFLVSVFVLALTDRMMKK